ncbi:hypothetical protein J22TS3_45500 [Paenibacillus sp. J22TS3]|nr:hypothetical protein J22TS3_45500 [Paenibacillus sp. J22TS3]
MFSQCITNLCEVNKEIVVETRIIHVHAHENIVTGEKLINPDKWNPLIYNFRRYFGLGPWVSPSGQENNCINPLALRLPPDPKDQTKTNKPDLLPFLGKIRFVWNLRIVIEPYYA